MESMSQERETAFFAAGCFWHIEEMFASIPGVLSTKTGYMGGKTNNPDYKSVCSGDGHAEVVKIEFDPGQTSFQHLMDIFWKGHDPSSLNRQGLDKGIQYRSAIFYIDEKQKKQAEESKNHIQFQTAKRIVTEITHAETFHPAEDYHQQYFKKNSSCGK